jgi:hypothetical protein
VRNIVKKTMHKIFIILLILIGGKVLAEPKVIDCRKGQVCEFDLNKKIQESYVHAEFVAMGSFGSGEKIKLETLSDELSMLYVTLNVDKLYKGQALDNAVKMKLPIYSPQYENRSSPLNNARNLEPATLALELESLERDLEQGRLATKEYENKVKLLRMDALTSKAFKSNEAFIVQIRRGSLDTFYRNADVPLVLGKKYIFFIFRDINNQYNTALFSSDIDLYPENKLSAVEAVLN